MDKIAKKLDLKAMGPVSKFLGMNFKRPNKYELNIDLTNYTHEIIKRFNKEKIRHVDTPMVPGLKLKKANIEPDEAIILNY